MSKKDVGVFQMENGNWAYRFKMVVDGKEINRRKSTDANGEKLFCKSDAIKAREAAMVAARTERRRQIKISRRTVKEVFEEYKEKGRNDRAYKTILKQDSLWKNHFRERWGNRYVDDIAVAEINDYLASLYYENEYSLQNSTSFLVQGDRNSNLIADTEVQDSDRNQFLNAQEKRERISSLPLGNDCLIYFSDL